MLNQNADRYKRQGDEVIIEAGGPPPLRIRLSDAIELDTVLAAEGIIIRCRGRYLVGPRTARELAAARDRDPHYWYSENGPIDVDGVKVGLGKTVPIIDVNVSGLEEIADRQAFAIRTAGVTEVDWSYDDLGIIPKGVLEQINWTVSPGAPRPADRWRLAELNLKGDYSYETLKIAPPSASGRIDYEAIGEIVRRVSERLKILRDDFNYLTDIHTQGILPDGTVPGPLQESAITEVPAADPTDSPSRVKKETRVVGVNAGPTDRANLANDIVSALTNEADAAERERITAAAAEDERIRKASEEEQGPRSVVDRAVQTVKDVANFWVTKVVGATTPVGIIARGLRKLFGRR